MKFTRTRNGVVNNTWVEGNTVHVQDLRTGKTRTITREQARRDLREVSADTARAYANED